MALAAFDLKKQTGSSPGSESAVTSKAGTYLSADEHDTVPANHKIAIPDLVSDPANYSYEGWFRLKCSAAPNNQVDNIKVWGADEQPGGDDKVTQYIGTTASGYSTPVATVSSVATTRVDTGAYDYATGIAVGVVPGDDIINAVDEYSDYFVLQLKVEFGASAGTMPTQLFLIRYDES